MAHGAWLKSWPDYVVYKLRTENGEPVYVMEDWLLAKLVTQVIYVFIHEFTFSISFFSHCLFYTCYYIYCSIFLAGDGSASTMWDNDHWVNLTENSDILREPLYVVPDYIHHMTPQARIIVMLRNPTDR